MKRQYILNEIRSRLYNGLSVKLECIDRDGYSKHKPVYYANSVLNSGLIVRNMLLDPQFKVVLKLEGTIYNILWNDLVYFDIVD